MSNPKVRRRISFTPIILTSKSIRPVDRAHYEHSRNERNYLYLRKTRDDLSNYLFRESPNSPTRFNSPEPGTPQDQEEPNDRLGRKIATPTVVKMEFQREMNRSRRRAETKFKSMKEQEAEQRGQLKNYFYYTNAKTFEEFTKTSKIRPSKLQSQNNQDWKKYLDKYYPNIQKMKPLLKKQLGYRLLSPQKGSPATERQNIIEGQVLESVLLLERLHINNTFRSQSKLEDAVDREEESPSKKHEGSQGQLRRCGQEDFTIYKRIEQDINNHRSAHKKDFFVFGLSETVSKSAEAQIKIKVDLYRDFLFRINFTQGLYVCSREEADRPFKFYVGFGNNSAIIKGIMRRRFWWTLTDKLAEDTNFAWTQLKVSDFSKNQQRSLRKFALQKTGKVQTQQRQDEGEQQPNKAIMRGEDRKIWQKYYERNLKFQEKGLEAALPKRIGGLLRNKNITIIDSSHRLKVHNHFQRNYFLGNKKALFYSMRKYYQLQGKDPFSVIPLTFHLSQGLTDPEFDRFLAEFQRQSQKRKTQRDFRNVWIVKPGELTNRGRGITVCSTLDQIKIRLKAKQRNGNGAPRTFIVQKYIERPLLYQRRKFDIRHYMAMTCINGRLKGYWYADGYVRTTSSQYNIKNTRDLLNHLTNDAVQKYGQDYGKYEKGNKVSYGDFQKYISNNVNLEVSFHKQILPKMKAIATDTMRATYSLLDHERKEHNFELFGLDFMLDEQFNVYLIEVNTNPCLETSCPLLTKIITPLVENLFKIGLDPLFPPPYDWPTQRKYNLGDNAFEENRFELVFDECEEGNLLRELYRNAEGIDERMGEIDEQQQEYKDEEKEWNDQQQSPKK